MNKIIDTFKNRSFEAKIRFPKGEYENESLPPEEEIRHLIINSMRQVGIQGDRLSIENENKIYGAFTGLLRKKPVSPTYQKVINQPILTNTVNMSNESVRYSTLMKDTTIFYTDDYENEIINEQKDIFHQIVEELPRKRSIEVNKYNFKTPLNIVFASMEPEKKFVERLIKPELSSKIDSWIKSRDVGFYSIEYLLRKGANIKSFNPDFFIKIDDNILVVEVKADGDDSDENKAKYHAANRHFKALNKELEANGIEQRYWFFFLSPSSYNDFVEFIIDNRIFSVTFRSSLEDLIDKEEDESSY